MAVVFYYCGNPAFNHAIIHNINKACNLLIELYGQYSE